MQETRGQEQELQPVQTECSNNRSTLTSTEASAINREQHEATIQWNLLSDVQLRKEAAERSEMDTVTVKGPTLFSHCCYKYSLGLTGFQQ